MKGGIDTIKHADPKHNITIANDESTVVSVESPPTVNTVKYNMLARKEVIEPNLKNNFISSESNISKPANQRTRGIRNNDRKN